MAKITLLTDFGYRDGYPGVMKGVIWSIAPDADIADISHSISPQNVMEGAIALGRTAKFFPPGTVHVAVVDPGVGTTRRPIATQIGEQFFVAPDNGVLSIVMDQAEEKNETIRVFHLDNPKYWLQEISNVFHGRDIFSPVGAYCSIGVPIEEMGTLIHDPVRLKIPRPESRGDGWVGEVVSIDYFGNLATNLKRQHLEHMGPVLVRVCDTEIHGMVRTFGERPVGDLIALYGTMNDLLISVVNGNAAAKLQAKIGDQVKVIPLKDEK